MNIYEKLAAENEAEFKYFLKNIFPHTMKWEGGGKLHNVEGDSGGWTIYGIAWNHNKQYFKDFDSFKNITQEYAAKFAFANYYLKLSPGSLPNNIKLLAFDIAYNMGLSKSVEYIQQCAGVTADGIIGPNTRKNMASITPDCLQNKRVAYYNALNKQPKFKKFYNGWMNRANDIFAITKRNK